MIVTNPYFRSYLFTALQETPILFRYLTSHMTEAKADIRVEAHRFTLREAIAHITDWETVYQERLRRIVEEEEPELPNIDEGQRAIDREYTSTDWREQLSVFETRRVETVEYLKTLPPEAWERRGDRPEIGFISVLELVHLMTLHDLYHLKQAREFLE